MKRLATLVLCASLTMPVAAVDPVSFFVPSPLTILLTIGKWTKKEQVEVFYVQVQAHGRDEADARDQAFRLAVNQAVGSLLLSHSEVRDGDVRRHDIINYSSGYIQDFKILDRSYGSGVTIKADVWVSRSSIADRLLSESRSAGVIEGGRISEQIRSFQKERQGADSVVDSVLADYPARAYNVIVGKTSVVIDANRRPILQVPFRLSWNEKFVDAFSEAIKTVNQHPDCGGWFDPCINRRLTVINAGKSTGYFNDEIIQQKVFNVMFRARARIQILGTGGQVQFSECVDVPEIGAEYSPWKFVDVGGGSIRVNPGRWKDYVYALDITRLPTDRLDRVEVSIERHQSCSP